MKNKKKNKDAKKSRIGKLWRIISSTLLTGALMALLPKLIDKGADWLMLRGHRSTTNSKGDDNNG